MPLYEYDCPQCGRFEVLQKLSDRPLEKHDCGKKVKKVVSAGAFSFKGSGFYVNDYKNKSAKTEAPACDKPKSEACGSCPSKTAAA